MRIYLVGSSKVPYDNTASDIRLGSFAELFVKCGYEVLVVNRYATLSDAHTNRANVLNNGYRIIELLKPRKNVRLFSLLFVFSTFIEFFFLLKESIRNGADGVLHIYSGHYTDLVFYRIISFLTGFKIVYQYVEYRSEINRSGLYHKYNGYMFDNYGPKLWHGAIAISHFLNDRALEVNEKLITLIGPPICDYTQFEDNKVKKEKTVLFCGSAGYFDVVKLIIDSYTRSSISREYNLQLILSGSLEQIKKVRDYSPSADIKTRLPYPELIECYNRASILMIPLRNTIQDIARFPNKICEYAASRGVIVTTCFGEPAYFFEDKCSAMISNDYSVDAVSEKLDWLYSNQQEIEHIGESGFLVGKRNFDIAAYVDKMKSFIEKLN